MDIEGQFTQIALGIIGYQRLTGLPAEMIDKLNEITAFSALVEEGQIDLVLA